MRRDWYNKLTLDNPNLFLDILRIRRMKKQDSIILVVGQNITPKSVPGNRGPRLN